ncbi:MAG: SH3 domain-containing protein [Clostridia bacterium]|nr:SH3 domain-containing protein [Clostridia bacterium]
MYSGRNANRSMTKAALLVVMLLFVLHLSNFAYASEVQVHSAPLSTMPSSVNGMVRVYLSSLGAPTSLDLTVQGTYRIGATGENLTNGSQASLSFNPATGTITFASGGRNWNMGQGFSLRRVGTDPHNSIKIRQARESNNPYPGDLSFKAVASTGGYKLYTIAHVFIEDYLCGVLPYEMGNSSNIEALKAQAVAARTYTVRMMKARASGLYDVQDTTNDQTYRGTPTGNANCVAAVDTTRGVVLMYGSDYITTYYSASNGGQTEVARTGVKYAYMTVKDDPFDYANPSSTVKRKTIYADLASSSNIQLTSLLKSKVVPQLLKDGYAATYENTTLGTLKSVAPHTPKYVSPSRLYSKMDFTFTATTQSRAGYLVTVSKTVTCDIFSELESLLGLSIQSTANELWSVTQNGSNFEIQVRRYGHGMGMSQRGAMYMAKLGYTYDQILGFYYENCSRVKHSFTSSVLMPGGDEHVSVQQPTEDENVSSLSCYGTVKLISNAAQLAVRIDKNASSALAGVLSNGAKVEVLTNEAGWCLVRFGSICGYVPNTSLTIVGTPTGNRTEPTSILGFATVTATDYVNLRTGESTATAVAGTAPSGAVLTVFSSNGSWAKVQYHTTAAYVSTQFISQISAIYPSGGLSSGSASASITSSDGGSVNLRAQASTAAQVITQLAYGTKVTIVSDDGSWARVECLGMNGYVMSQYLKKEDDDPERLPENTDTPEGEKAVVATQSGSLNMRSQPYAGSLIIISIPRNTEITVLERGEVWSSVYYSGRNGYVMTSFLRFAENEPSQKPEYDYAFVVTPGGGLNMRQQPWTGSMIICTIPQGAKVSISEYGNQWCSVLWQGMQGYVMTQFLSFDSQIFPELPESNTQAPSVLNKGWATVTTASGALNLRAEPSAWSQVLRQIPRNTKIYVDGQVNEWSIVEYGGIKGYVMTSYLLFDVDPPEQDDPAQSDSHAGKTAYAATESGSLNLRSQPSAAAEVLAFIPRGDSVVIMSYGETWSSVLYGGKAGFVMSRYLAFEPLKPDYTQSIPQIKQAWVNTTSGSLNVRSAASTDAFVVTTLPKGTKVSLLAQDGEWGCIEWNGIQGYVKLNYLSFEEVHQNYGSGFSNPENLDLSLQVPSTAMFGYATDAGGINLWSECSEGSSLIMVVPSYEEFEIVLVGDNWCCIQYRGIQGYCRKELVSVIDE